MNSVFVETQNWCTQRDFHFGASQLTESTNSWAKNEFKKISEPTLFLADRQSAGRGRGENKWTNPASGSGLLCSFAYPLELPPQPIASPLFGIGLFKSVRKSWPSLDWSLKPPNDLKLGQKKIAGLLVESVQAGDRILLIVGLGINVLSHPEAEKSATCLDGDEGLGKELNTQKWHEFLDHLSSHFSLASQACGKTRIDDQTRIDLVEALNKDPNKSEAILDVSDFGDIVFEGKTTSWKDL